LKHGNLLPERGILCLKLGLRLGLQHQQPQKKNEQRDHYRVTLSDSVAGSIRIMFSVHTATIEVIANNGCILQSGARGPTTVDQSAAMGRDMALERQIKTRVRAFYRKSYPDCTDKRESKNNFGLTDAQIEKFNTGLAIELGCDPTRSQILACKSIGALIDLLIRTRNVALKFAYHRGANEDTGAQTNYFKIALSAKTCADVYSKDPCSQER
jgi:hypothetical protein